MGFLSHLYDKMSLELILLNICWITSTETCTCFPIQPNGQKFSQGGKWSLKTGEWQLFSSEFLKCKQYHSRAGPRKEKLSCLSVRAQACPNSLIQNILYSLADQMKAITNKTFCSSSSRWQFVLLLFLKHLARCLASDLQGFICLLVKLWWNFLFLAGLF